MKHLLILISILLLSSPVIGDNHKGETLYLWGKLPNYKWVGFGDKEEHCIYKGQVKNSKPNGVGFLECKEWLTKYMGEFKNGEKHGFGKNTEFSLYGNPVNKYEGNYNDGSQEGKGTWTNYHKGYYFIGKFEGSNFSEGKQYTMDGEYWCKIDRKDADYERLFLCVGKNGEKVRAFSKT